MKRKLFYTFIFYILFSNLTFASPSPSLIAEGAILIEPKTKTILYSKNINSQFYPASTTKVLTSLLLVESMDEDGIITKSQASIENVPSDSSHIGLSAGDQYSYSDGLYGIMMGSDNYISYDMAVYNAGSIEAFTEKMNEKAQSLGALSSHFVNPHGYHDPNHYTTPYDLSLITAAAFDNPILSQIGGTPVYDFTVLDKDKVLNLTHTAAFFKKNSPFYNTHVLSAKTGYHTPAGRTLVAKATYGDLDLIAVVMKSNNPGYFEDINKLFEYGSSNFNAQKDVNGNLLIHNISYSDWGKPYVESALTKGWVKPTTKSYMDATTGHRFLITLDNMFPTSLKYKLVPYRLPVSPVYKINQSLSRNDAALLFYNICKKLSIPPHMPDYTKLQDATYLLSKNGQAIDKNAPLTLEEGLYLTEKLSILLMKYAPIHPALSH